MAKADGVRESRWWVGPDFEARNRRYIAAPTNNKLQEQNHE
jgi:hypothetical protein